MALESSGSNLVCFANIKQDKFNRAPGRPARSSELGGKQGQAGTAEAGKDRQGQAETVRGE